MKGVLLMTYGTPRSLEGVEEYYTNIRGGQKPTQDEIENLRRRYEAIGGTSPLIRITENLRAKLQRSLSDRGSGTLVYSAMKHSEPFIADVVKQAAGDGVDELLSIALAPHYSKMSVGTYMLAVEMANASLPRKMRLDSVSSWHLSPKLVEAWASRIRRAGQKLPRGYSLVFSAHSLPERILAGGDPYRYQLIETCESVASALGKTEWSFAFQSAGHTRDPWLGPDILAHLQTQFDGGSRSFLIAPIGFVADHLEILYDIDIECREWAAGKGARLERCDMLNDDDDFVGCLQSVVDEKKFL
ncbi:MAG: ferrochelatase [Nitrososphaerota archaeon]|nr:ferrochelatase [Nitrososphaerota archaeon]MDG7023888.1 ferrochelatase [Nitrososphaerota archaeon]